MFANSESVTIETVHGIRLSVPLASMSHSGIPVGCARSAHRFPIGSTSDAAHSAMGLAASVQSGQVEVVKEHKD